MAIQPKCDKCQCELNDYGALLFSPPSSEDLSRKWHLCKECYAILEEEFIAENK